MLSVQEGFRAETALKPNRHPSRGIQLYRCVPFNPCSVGGGAGGGNDGGDDGCDGGDDGGDENEGGGERM